MNKHYLSLTTPITTYTPPIFIKYEHTTSTLPPNCLNIANAHIYMTDDTFAELAEALIRFAYNNNNLPQDTLDSIAYMVHVMADDRGYAEAAADSAYDQFVDDAALGI